MAVKGIKLGNSAEGVPDEKKEVIVTHSFDSSLTIEEIKSRMESNQANIAMHQKSIVEIQAEMDAVERRLEIGKKFHVTRVGQEWDIEQEHRGSPAGVVVGQWESMLFSVHHCACWGQQRMEC